ncbi:MAG TPA: hypothetical protein VFV01_21135 [Spirillospora sp.]|nr:hypothetical protein [Spirillospora sp.]
MQMDDRGEASSAAGWVLSSNVRPLMEMISEVVEYDFDDSDWLAISTALPDTDDEQADCWYAYPLVGVRQAQVRLSRAVGGDEVSVEVTGISDDRTRESIELLLTVFARYEVDAER